MRLLILLLVLLAGSSRASLLAWEGTLALHFASSELGEQQFAGGGIATVNAGQPAPVAALKTLQLTGGIQGAFSVPVTDPEVTATVKTISVRVTLGSGTLGPFWPPAPLGQEQLTRKSLPVRGDMRICLIVPGNCSSVLRFNPSTANHAVGQGGSWVNGTAQAGGALQFTIQAAPWTVGTARLDGLITDEGGTLSITKKGWIHGANSFTGTTALVGGAVNVVTPTFIQNGSDEFPHPVQPWANVADLTIRFVPEPGLLLLLGSGVLGLALIGWREERRLAQRKDDE